MFHDGSVKVVQHVARVIMEAEMGYNQPNFEEPTVMFLVTKFHKMIFGRKLRFGSERLTKRYFGVHEGSSTALGADAFVVRPHHPVRANGA